MGYGKKIKDWFTEDVEDDEEGYEPATSDTEPRTSILDVYKRQTLNESKPLEALSEREELERLGVEIVAGGQPSELFERDFSFVVKNPGIKYTEWFIERLEDRGIPIYTEIELAYQLASWHHYLAVTGTNGKTTTVTLIGEILKKAFSGRTYVAGNIGTPLCEVLLEEKLDERQDCYLVLEMSNFQLLNIDQFKPEVATIINLTPDHLDYMRSLDEYYASKTRIYMNQDRQDQFVLNEDCLLYTSRCV